MNQLQCKIGEIAQEIVRGILTGKDISKGRHNTPRGPNAISRCKCNTRWYILKIGREGSISVIQGAKQNTPSNKCQRYNTVSSEYTKQ